MAVAVGDIWFVGFRGKWHNQKTLSTFTYRTDNVNPPATESAFAVELVTAITAAGKLKDKFLACCPPQYTLDEIWVQKVSPSRYFKHIAGLFAAGTHGSTSNMTVVAAVITRRGALGQRNNIGSLHVPAPNKDANIADGHFGGAYIATLNALGAEMLVNYNLATLGGIHPILWHGGTAGNFDILVQCTAQSPARVMRRRTVGVGE